MDVLQRRERLVMELFVVLRERNFGWDWPDVIRSSIATSSPPSHPDRTHKLFRCTVKELFSSLIDAQIVETHNVQFKRPYLISSAKRSFTKLGKTINQFEVGCPRDLRNINPSCL